MLRTSPSAPLRPVERLEQAEALDPVAEKIRTTVRRALGRGAARDALHGVWFGHPLHPALAQVPLGTWISAALLDLLPGRTRDSERAAGILIGTGLIGSASAAAAGLADFSELHEQGMRVGVVHATANSAAAICYAASLIARASGNHRLGRRLSTIGLGVASASAYLGGHLAYRRAAGANHAEDVPYLVPSGWHRIARLDDLVDGRPEVRQVMDVPVVLLRRGDHVDVLADRCSHLSGPLHQGKIVRENGSVCLRCPWHHSTFRVDVGAVIHGPATAPQPRFDVEISGGDVRVRLPEASARP